MTLTVDLPYPPTTNHAYLVARGRKVKTAAARAYASSVQGVLMANPEARAFRSALARLPGPSLAVTIGVQPPDRRRRDLANTEKLCVDAVCSWLGVDDSRIDRLSLARGEVTPGGALRFTLEAIA